MEIIPKLNLNAHPKNVDNNSLVDGVNLMLSDDGVIQTERGGKYNTAIYNAIFAKYGEHFKIVYCIECNIELVIFVQRTNTQADLSIFRYNEKEDKCYFIIDNFKYSGGKLLGTFTYNKDKLIIAVSEYFDDNSQKIPLRVLNLGEFKETDTLHVLDYAQLTNNDLHYILPKVRIPNVNTSIVSGNTHKGWHFIFIRYKISHNTYTNWFNTNEVVYIDDFSNQKILNYYVSQALIDKITGSTTNNANEVYRNSTVERSISDQSDISDYSYIMSFDNLDSKYIAYQIGIVVISKTYSKCYYSEDINIGTNIIKYYDFKEYSITDILTKYNNYYNAKTIETYNNKLYIGNYLEYEDVIDTKNISVNIGAVKRNTDTSITLENIISEKNVIPNITNPDWTIPVYRYNRTSPPVTNIPGLEGGITRTLNGVETLIKPDSTDVQFVYIICELYTFSEASNGYIPWGYHMYKFDFNRLVSLRGDHGAYALNVRENPGIILQPWFSYFKTTIHAGEQGFYPGNATIRIAITQDEIRTLQSWFPDYDFDSINIKDYEYKGTHLDDITNNIPKYTFNSDDWDWDNPVKESNPSDVIGRNFGVINSFGVNFNEYYNFYIHFVNEFGEITKGYNLSEFAYNINYDVDINTDIESSLKDECTIDIVENLNKNKLLVLKSNKHYQVLDYNSTIYKNYLKFKLDSIPEGYVGYFVSYEKLDKSVLYSGYCKVNILSTSIAYVYFYSDKFNYEDKIDFSFNKLILSSITKSNNVPDQESENKNANITLNKGNSSIHEITITNKELYVADDYNNVGKESYIKLTINLSNTNVLTSDDYFGLLVSDNVDNKYCTDVKDLVPCSQINYDKTKSIIVNTNDAFYSKNYIIKYIEEGALFDSGIFVFKGQGDYHPVITPYYQIRYDYLDSIPMESISFNNKPATIVFPSKGVTGTDSDKIGYNTGVIVEPKNSIDLFKQRQLSYYEASITSLNYYNPNVIHTDKYPKTIRRSYPILDESYEISWRKFAPDVYKNIQENKGNIVKVCNSGNILLVHTEYSLFVFDGNDSIKSVDDKIQLASIDIWDINYKELFSSKLGFGGISKEHHSIIGDFGYIWFDSEHYNLYRLDGQMKLAKIDEDIINFIKQFKPTDVIFGNDIINNRVLIMLINDNSKIALSYNTKSNTFISRHTYKYRDSYSTKNRIYLLDGSKQYLVNFVQDNNTKYEIINDVGNQMYSHIDIICKDNYENIKFLDTIQYKISKHSNVIDVKANDYLPVEGINGIKYAGDFIRIYSEYCDTDNLKVLFDDIKEFNNPDTYFKPYWHLGNWHFNAIRNKLKSYLDDGVTIADEHSRVYGNYFVIRLIFNTTDCVKIESLSNSYKYM